MDLKYNNEESINNIEFLYNHNLLFKVILYIFDYNPNNVDDKKNTLNYSHFKNLTPLLLTNKRIFNIIINCLNENRSIMKIDYTKFFSSIIKRKNYTNQIITALNTKNIQWFHTNYFMLFNINIINKNNMSNNINLVEFNEIKNLMNYNYFKEVTLDLSTFIPDNVYNSYIDIRDINIKNSLFLKYIRKKYKRKRKYILKELYFSELNEYINHIKSNYIINISGRFTDGVIEYINTNINNINILTLLNCKINNLYSATKLSNCNINTVKYIFNNYISNFNHLNIIDLIVKNNKVSYLYLNINDLNITDLEIERLNNMHLNNNGKIVLYILKNNFNNLKNKYKNKFSYIITIKTFNLQYASAYNILRLMSGFGGLAYES